MQIMRKGKIRTYIQESSVNFPLVACVPVCYSKTLPSFLLPPWYAEKVLAICPFGGTKLKLKYSSFVFKERRVGETKGELSLCLRHGGRECG